MTQSEPVMDLSDGLYEILAELLQRTTEGTPSETTTSRHRVQALTLKLENRMQGLEKELRGPEQGLQSLTLEELSERIDRQRTVLQDKKALLATVQQAALSTHDTAMEL